MSVKIQGGCLCGAIHYESHVELQFSILIYRCQRNRRKYSAKNFFSISTCKKGAAKHA